MSRIITISREFGSGGAAIGNLVAQKLGIPCYNQQLIDRIAEESGFYKDYVEEHTEGARTSWFGLPRDRDFYGPSMQDELFRVQTRVIREVVEHGLCIIVGRCADYILRRHDDLLTVFIHASKEKRIERILREYGDNGKDPMQRLHDKDKKRKAYYQLYTDRKWGDVENYHIALDSGVLGIERCAEIIAGLY